MTTPNPAAPSTSFLRRLLSAGIEPGDSEELRLNKSLLALATGLICAVMMIWAVLYSLLGLRISANVPIVFLLLLSGNLVLYVWTRNFNFFRVTQLGMFLFLPYVAQWSAGNLIISSGVILWGLLAPVGAILCIGARESLGWFIAWIFLTAVSGGVDYYLADPLILQQPIIPTRTSLLFFTLNFISIAAISYALLLFFIEQKRRAQERLEKARQQLNIANKGAENLVNGPIIHL
jgi:adenylate cyclase